MNRRKLLKDSVTAAALTMLPLSSLFAKEHKKISSLAESKTSGYRKIVVGDLDLTVITDGIIRQSPVFPMFAPLGTEVEVKELLRENFRPIDSIELGINVMVVKSKERLILLDTGMGMFAEALQGKLLASLGDAGYSASEVTDVILSHAHPDHVGGLVDKNQKLVFSNAVVHIAKVEFDFWQKAVPDDFKNSALMRMPDYLKQLIGGVQSALTIIRPKVRFIDMSTSLYDIFNFQLAPGHTPGLIMTTITSGSDKLVLIADLVNSDALSFTHPEWGFFGDTDLQLAIDSRRKILNQLATNGTRTFASHLPWPGLGHIRKKGAAFEWVAEVFVTP